MIFFEQCIPELVTHADCRTQVAGAGPHCLTSLRYTLAQCNEVACRRTRSATGKGTMLIAEDIIYVGCNDQGIDLFEGRFHDTGDGVTVTR